ncbi:DUF4823 domain-containing protein [Halopseudomonas pelagia]|uniref:DUF4823 domain-containing protein n=1 Tax=Halopseudomonas pelagia TaxID=553151 RepID=UPI00039FB6B8|nr:DUF4823 domain-containing protein [Halopseudomonas pelagia]
MRWIGLLVVLSVLVGCMKPSDMQKSARYYLGDAGLMNHYQIKRNATWRLQPDSTLYIAQGHFVPVGHPYARPNVVAEEAFAAAVQVFPMPRRAEQPLGLEEALEQAYLHRSDYLLYTRFARADDAVGDAEHWNESRDLADVGLDRAVLQMMLMETSTRQLVDFAVVETRGGFLQFYQAEPEDLLRPPLEDYTRRLLGR